MCLSFRQGPEFLGHPAIWWRWGTKDVPETDWGTDLLLQGWVGPKHAGRDTPTPQPWNPSQPPSQLGAPLANPVPNLSGHWHIPPTHSPLSNESHGLNTQ